MSKLEKAIVALVEVYEEYAQKDDKKFQLSQAELAELIEKELSSEEFKVGLSHLSSKTNQQESPFQFS